MTSSIVALKAILTSPTPTPHLPNHTYSHVHSWCLRHLHRDTRLLFLIKEIAFLCWLFYLMSWLPLCAQHQAAAGRRRRPAPLIGAWDARSAAAGPGGRSGRTLMSLPVWASLSPPSLSLWLLMQRSYCSGSLLYSSDFQITCTKLQCDLFQARFCRWKIDFLLDFYDWVDADA